MSDYKNRKDTHDYFEPDHVARFLRNHKTGIDNLGRRRLGEIISSYDNPVVLDAACGTGVNWEVFRNMGVKCQYIGLDRTRQFIDYAVERYNSKSDEIYYPGWYTGHVQELPWTDDYGIDIVILRHILEHLSDGYEDAIREALRVASKEVILVFFIDPSNRMTDDIKECGPDERDCTYFWNTYSWPLLLQFLSQFGVKISRERVETPGAAAADTIIRLRK